MKITAYHCGPLRFDFPTLDLTSNPRYMNPLGRLGLGVRDDWNDQNGPYVYKMSIDVSADVLHMPALELVYARPQHLDELRAQCLDQGIGFIKVVDGLLSTCGDSNLGFVLDFRLISDFQLVHQHAPSGLLPL